MILENFLPNLLTACLATIYDTGQIGALLFIGALVSFCAGALVSFCAGALVSFFVGALVTSKGSLGMRFVTFCVVLCVLGVMASPQQMLDEESVVGGVWCESVGVAAGCPPPEVNGGGQISALCAALAVTRADAGWPGQELDVLNGGNCTQKRVGNPLWPCGHQVLGEGGECDPHIAWLPW
jgi:hypothetical protein